MGWSQSAVSIWKVEGASFPGMWALRILGNVHHLWGGTSSLKSLGDVLKAAVPRHAMNMKNLPLDLSPLSSLMLINMFFALFSRSLSRVPFIGERMLFRTHAGSFTAGLQNDLLPWARCVPAGCRVSCVC